MKTLLVLFSCLLSVVLIADSEYTFGMFETRSERAKKLAERRKIQEEAKQQEEKERALRIVQKAQEREYELRHQQELYALKLKEKEIALEQKKLELAERTLKKEQTLLEREKRAELVIAQKEISSKKIANQSAHISDSAIVHDAFSRALSAAEKRLDYALHTIKNQQQLFDDTHQELMHLTTLAFHDAS